MSKKSPEVLRQFIERDKWLHTAVEKEQAEFNAAWRLGWLDKCRRLGPLGSGEPRYEYSITEAGRQAYAAMTQGGLPNDR